ncbi:acetyl-CoA carboxylase carboxyltransferase subunit alpha [Candidatus Eisenbacteria bacterium]|uniref:Acetyl-coenzyme A carboxylase carboxyl transferase subunit alpha n=1 Tax=Eiseniibacteriota bacterium TaxID=2212470 RepID=A0ABV6YNJ8_UNCEI
METWLDFEKPLIDLEKQIRDLESLAEAGHPEIGEQIDKLKRIADKKRRETYENLNRWERVQLARHPLRPYTLDYVKMIASDFTELHGDRLYSEDKAIIGGLAVIEGHKVVLIGHQKGRDTKENLNRNFGMSNPEGYRKALRLMKMAAKFGKPLVTLVDTPGAYPGIGAEERGQAEAIARNLLEMSRLPVPILVIVIGEGGSGGALGIGVGDRVIMMEYAIYSVISPEGCAAILWGDRGKAEQAAEAMKVTAPDLLQLGVVDGMVPEPIGGAHRDPRTAAENLKKVIVENLDALAQTPVPALLERRLEKYSRMGTYIE